MNHDAHASADPVKAAIDDYKSFDSWQFADREATWRWMFQQGEKYAREQISQDNDRLVELLGDIILSSNANDGDSLANAIQAAINHLGNRIPEGAKEAPGMFAIGRAENSQLNSFAMLEGPSPSLQHLLDQYGAEDCYIVRFNEYTPIPIRRWDDETHKWAAMPEPELNPEIPCLFEVDAAGEATGTAMPFCCEQCRDQTASTTHQDWQKGTSRLNDFGYTPHCEDCNTEITPKLMIDKASSPAPRKPTSPGCGM